LFGIAAGPGGIAFAVGANCDTLTPALSMKWTGKAWQEVTVSAPSGSSLNAVTFAPGGTAWAAGSTGLLTGRTMILRWNGSAWGVPPSPPPPATGYRIAGGLTGVAAVSNSSACAVGYAGSGSPKVLMVHWNGSKWTRVTSPAVLTGAGELTAITVVNAKDAWAVGYTGPLAGSRTLLLHWNGAAWRQVTSPAPVAGALDAVTATATSGWAVGSIPNGHNYPKSLALRLSGSTWSRASTGNYGIVMTGVAIAGSRPWAIGAAEDHSEIGHWTGSTWTWQDPVSVQDQYYLYGIAAGPGGAAFTVGYAYLAPAYTEVTGSLRLSGTTWKPVTVSAPAGTKLGAVTFAPGGTAWAAGQTGPSTDRTVILRWTGSAWTRVASASPGSSDSLAGLGFSAEKYGWAVGRSGSNTLVLHWNGSTWA
jgi:hypothetical protein